MNLEGIQIKSWQEVQIICLLCKRLQERKAERFSALLLYWVYFPIFVRGWVSV